MKHKSWLRALVLMLAVVTVLSLWVPAARAAETEGAQIFTTSVKKVNPLYASGQVPPMARGMVSPDHTYFSYTFEGAVGDLRTVMLNRVTQSTIAFPVELQSKLTDEAALEAELWAYEEALFQAAVAHSGTAYMGDYLYYSHYGRAAEVGVLEDSGTVIMVISYYIVYHDTEAQETAVSKVVKDLTNSWNLNDATDYEKVRTVYDWLCENVIYPDVIGEEYGAIYSAYGALVNQVSVCQGYALAMYRLLNSLGVDCRIITGTGNGGPHAWNIVKIGDYYYNLDATWDSIMYQEGFPYGWFLTSDAEFYDHQRAPEYMTEEFYAVYPMSPESYSTNVLASGVCGDNLTWALGSERTFVIVGTGDMYDYTAATQPWKEYANQIGRVYIDDGVTSIGDYAFADCKKLEEIRIPENIMQIGDYAFYQCEKLSNLTFPTGITDIGDYAFYSCTQFNRVKLPENLESIGAYAFGKCKNVMAFAIYQNVTQIGSGAFSDCKALQYMELPEGLNEISDSLFSGCEVLAEVTIPETITRIGAYAFNGCKKLGEILIPDGVTEIGGYAFRWCSALRELAIPGVTSIGEYAFYECENLREITLQEGITSIEPYTFGGAQSLTSIIIPKGVTAIGEYAFACCVSLTDISIPDTVTSIDRYAFNQCHELTEISLPQNLTSITQCMFSQSGLTSIVIPNGVTSIDNHAFSQCSDLAGVSLPEGLLSIDSMAFYGCKSLTDIAIPVSVTYIGEHAFWNCTALTSIAIPNGVTSIEWGAFKECSSLQNVTIPQSITSIAMSAFEGCIKLNSVTIPQTVTSIGTTAFKTCSNLTYIVIPSSVTSIGGEAFSACQNLKEVRFLGDAPKFAYRTFKGNTLTIYYPKDASGWNEAMSFDHSATITWVAEEAPPFQLVGSSVSLGDSLDFHFFISSQDVVASNYAVVTRTYADGREDHVITVPYADWSALEDGTLYVTYPGIAAKEMGDTLSVVVYNKNGKAISEAYADSIQAYAMRLLEKESDPELLTLLVDMLNYGAEAQTYFTYDTENLVNDELTEIQKGYATTSYEAQDLLEAGKGRGATALTLKNRISLDLLFNCGITGVDFASLYAEVTYTDHNGEAVAYRIEGKDFVEAEGFRVCVSVTGLAVADYGQAVTCTVYDAQGKAVAWVTDSISGYVARMEDNIPDVVSSIAKFGTAAWNYFH